ncbi:MAG: AAA family ATPase [Euryarchaeota archaeon]|nr:AAA family ATPase [Euryarchaeota archaeon]
MILIITGTPGTGKSTVAGLLSRRLGLKLIRLSALAGRAACGYDAERGSVEVDVERLFQIVRPLARGDVVIEGHLAHLLPFREATVVVLRCSPAELEERLRKKGFPERKIRENLEAEALDVCLIESLQVHSDVYEVDTSGMKAEQVAERIERILAGEGEAFRPGKVDWSEEFFAGG